MRSFGSIKLARRLKKSNFNNFNEPFTASCTFKKLLDLGRLDGGNFSQNYTSLQMLGQVSITQSANPLSCTEEKWEFVGFSDTFEVFSSCRTLMKDLPYTFQCLLNFPRGRFNSSF